MRSLLLVCCLALASLAPLAPLASLVRAAHAQPTMSLSTFSFRCKMFDGGKSSIMDRGECGLGDQADTCDAFVEMLRQGFPDQGACRRACNDLRATIAQRLVFRGCDGVLFNARDTCTRYCLANYP